MNRDKNDPNSDYYCNCEQALDLKEELTEAEETIDLIEELIRKHPDPEAFRFKVDAALARRMKKRGVNSQ